MPRKPVLSKDELQKTIDAYKECDRNACATADKMGLAAKAVRRRLRIAALQGMESVIKPANVRDGPECPKCHTGSLSKWGKTDRGGQRWGCTLCGYRTTNPTARQETTPVVFPSKIPRSKRYIFTSAQNATPVHKGFLSSLINYAEHVGASLVAIPYRYRNPTSLWTGENEDHEWWANEIVPYLYDGRFDICEGLSILADIKVQPTAANPLTGLETISGAKSAVIGHPKIQFTTVPTPQNQMPKILTTTGSITRRNYTDTKAGKKGEFHHAFGATMVEVQGKTFHIRQISAVEDGSFIDLQWSATPNGVKKAPRAAGLIMGDTHVGFDDPKVTNATLAGKDSIVSVLRPKKLVWHDLLDFYSANHHHRNDPFIAHAKRESGLDDVSKEVDDACEHVNKHTPKNTVSVIVPSNHNEALDRWIRETDWRTEPVNKRFYLETALVMLKSVEMSESGSRTIDPFIHWAGKKITCNAVFLERDQSYTIEGIECGLHGDMGANGARGGIRTFSRMGVKSIVGHRHAPGILDGCYQTGTSTYLNLEYTSGPSSWLQTHCVVYANGKRSLITVINGKWRL